MSCVTLSYKRVLQDVEIYEALLSSSAASTRAS
jgi:hypothetical protein